MNEQNSWVKSFLMDEAFQAWVTQPTDETNAYWESYAQQHPDRKEAMQQARQWLQALHTSTAAGEDASQEDFTQVWQRIQDQTSAPVVPLVATSRWYRWAAAAAVIGVVMVGSWWFVNRPQTYTTAYGEIKSITLPDGSTVVLNSNSKLEVARDWDENQTREAWLQGEAFFSVQKKPAHTRFIVHTKNLNVEVLGTKFNVNDRRGETRVVLTEGKIKIVSKNKAKADTLYMQPGELVQTSRQKPLEKKLVRPENYSSWKENKLIFENATLHEIARTIEDYYGTRIYFEDTVIADKRFTGTLPNNNMEIVIRSLSGIYGLEVEKTEEGEILMK